jgi:hypothetical protein
MFMVYEGDDEFIFNQIFTLDIETRAIEPFRINGYYNTSAYGSIFHWSATQDVQQVAYKAKFLVIADGNDGHIIKEWQDGLPRTLDFLAWLNNDMLFFADSRDFATYSMGDENYTIVQQDCNCRVFAVISEPIVPPVAGCDMVSTSGNSLITNITQANTASTPQTICLNANATYTFSQSSTWFFGDTALPPITGNITIKGNGATLERAATAPDFRLFGVDGTGTLTLENLTLNGGSLNENAGGAIVNVGGTVNLNNVTLENHQALSTSEGSGGAIYNYFGTLTMTNSQLVNNSAAVGAGGIYNWGGSITMSNTCIAVNSAPYGLAITQFDTATTIVRHNWWGAADGPGGEGSGSGDGVGASIAYTPFLTSEAAPCAPDVPTPTYTPTETSDSSLRNTQKS